MIMKYTSLMIVLLVLAAPVRAQTVQVRELWHTKGPPGEQFSFVAGVAEGPDGHIWISDSRNGQVLSIAGDGSAAADFSAAATAPVRSIIRPSSFQGRREASRSTTTATTARSSSAPMVRFVRLVRFPFYVINPKGFAVLENGDLLVSGGVPARSTAMHRFDAQGKLVAEWYDVPKTEDPRAGWYVAGGALSAASGHSFLFSQAAPHLILRYHPDGRADTLAADPSILDPIGDDFMIKGPTSTRFRWFFPQSRGVFELADHRILNVITIRREYRSIWQVYSPAGNLLAQTTLPRGYVVWNLARNGDLLASYQDPDTDEDVVARLRMRVR